MASVWDSDFAGVWHFSGDAKDSTSHEGHGVFSGLVTPTSGAAAGALSFRNTGSITLSPNPDFMGSLEEFTISLWVRLDATATSAEALVFNLNGHTTYPRLRLQSQQRPQVQFQIATSTVNTVAVNAIVPTGTYRHIAATFAALPSNQSSIFLDGLHEATNGHQSGPLSTGGNGPVRFGYDVTDDVNLDGSLDEIRVSRVPRQSDWIAMEHASMDTAFATVGPRQDRSCP